MTLPNFVTETLRFIDANWNTTNRDPKPRLYDGRDMREYRNGAYTGNREIEPDLTDGATIVVHDGDGVDETPEGLSWEFNRIDGSVRVRCEGAYRGRTNPGTVSGADEWRDLWQEARRTLQVERKRPLTDYYWLRLDGDEQNSNNYGDYYRTELFGAYVGLDELP